MGKGAPRLLRMTLWALALWGGLIGIVRAQGHSALLLEVNGIINPVAERFIARGIRQAEQENAALVIIRLDTPGGLLDSTRQITQHLLNAEVPSVVYVAPRGARAASAGTFIAAAANFAVMAPGTNIGAASPVGASGEDLPQTLKSKAFSDAAAEMRSIAAARGRNAEKLEATVLQALSFTADEAIKENIVDFMAGDVDEMLKQLHGREAQLKPPEGRRITLDTRGLVVRTQEMSLVDRFLRFISDPNVAFLLLSLGTLGIVVELWNPGMVVPGVVGAILLVLAFLGLGNLPTNWAGIALILLAAALAILEVHVSGFGALGVGAIISFVLGSFLLFFHGGLPSPTMPRIGISLWVLVPTAAILAVGGGAVLWTIVKSRREEPATGPSSLIGATGYAVTDLSPRGVVQVAGEQWSATSGSRQTIASGREIRVTQVSGAFLTVALVETGPGNGAAQAEGYNASVPPDSRSGG